MSHMQPPPLQNIVDASDSEKSDSSDTKPTKAKHRKGLILAGIFVLVISISIPSLSLIFGLGILFICLGVFVPRLKTLSSRFLRLNSPKRWKRMIRFSMYCLMGLFFILYSIFSYGMKDQRERLAAEEAIEHSELIKNQNEANKIVADLAEQAEVLWVKGDLQKAREKLASAKKTQHANILTPVQQVETKIANARVQSIMADAMSAAEEGRLEVAKQKVNEALGESQATNLKPARELYSQLGLAENSERINKIMLELSEDEFSTLRNGTMPTLLITGLSGIDQQIKNNVGQQLGQVSKNRQNLKKEAARKERINDAAKIFVNSGVGKKVPYESWNVLGYPKTLEGTDNRYWVAYLEKGDVSFVSEKTSDIIIFAAFGRNSAPDYLSAKKARREKIVEEQFSSLDGSHRGLTELIKKTMNDPSSYDHDETVYWDMGDHLVVLTTFRGKNAFGGIVKNSLKAKVDFKGNVIEILE